MRTRNLYLQSVQPYLTWFQEDDATGGLFCGRSFYSAGGRFQAEDVSTFARHGPLYELGQLLGIEPEGEGEPECGVLQARLGHAIGPTGGPVVEDLLLETRSRGGEPVPGCKSFPRHIVPWLRPFPGSPRTDQVGRCVEEWPAEVDVVEDHERLRLVAFVLDLVFYDYARFADAGRDATPQHQVGAKDAGLPDLPGGLDNAPFVIPQRIVGDPGSGNMGSAAVQAEFFPSALAGEADVSQAASNEEPAGERAEPSLARGFIE